jgi:glycine dehydrogenase
MSNLNLLNPLDVFAPRHLGPRPADIATMLDSLGVDSLEALMDEAVPQTIRMSGKLSLDEPLTESQALGHMRQLADKNKVYRSYLGQGYHGCLVPTVIQRNILENPGWYTHYTPYQAEISQGRQEAMLNFQTMVSDLTGLEVANASVLDEGTAAAEAMLLCLRAQSRGSKANAFFVSDRCHPQTIAVVQTRAEPLGIDIIVGDHESYDFNTPTFGVLVQYPATNGVIFDYESFAAKAHENGALVVVACDLLALTLLRPPGEFGADIAVGNSQRFGVPMGYGGPHAAFMSTKDEHKRLIPGRIIGVSKDADGRPGLRLALQTREQHIRRDRATSNICTAQALLAVMASMYAVYHGPEGLRRIAQRVRLLTAVLREALLELGYSVTEGALFDTLAASNGPRKGDEIVAAALERGINLRLVADGRVALALDETVTVEDLGDILNVFGAEEGQFDIAQLAEAVDLGYERAARPYQRLPHPPHFQYVPQRNGNAALHAPAASEGHLPDPFDDPARLLHHEAERHHRNAACHLARIWAIAPVRSPRSGRGLHRTVRQPGTLAGRNHRLRRHLLAAQRRVAG